MKSEYFPTFSVFICFSCKKVMIIQKVFLSFLYKLENKLPRQANIGAVCSF